MREIRRIDYIIVGVMMFLVIVLCVIYASPAQAQPSMRQVTATAYYDAYGHGHGADGRPLVEGLTIAGRAEDLGKTALLYDEDMRLIGIYEFRDTGYGKATGRGQSRIFRGRSMGDIESGETVDIYFSTKAKCRAWGRRKVYLQIVDAKG